MYRLANPPPHLMPLTPEEIRDAAVEVGVKKFSPGFVSDMAYLSAGGVAKDFDLVRQEIADDMTRKFPLVPPGIDGTWKLPNGDETDDRDEALEAAISKRQMEAETMYDLLAGIDMTTLPGSNPLTRAFYLQKALNEAFKRKKMKGIGGGGGEKGAPPDFPIFPDDDEPESGNVGEDDTASEALMEVARKTQDPAWTAEIDRIARLLASNKRLNTRQINRFERDPDGDEVRLRRFNGLEDLQRILPKEWALFKAARPLFLQRLANRELPVREKTRRHRLKQRLWMFLDRSGSMTNHYRKARGIGVLLNRLEAVKRGDAELTFQLYDEALREEHTARNEKEAEELLRYVLNDSSNGGVTSIDSALRHAVKRIRELRETDSEFVKPEIMVVLDGDDQISVSPSEFFDGAEPIKVNVMLVGHENVPLRQLAEKTGGVTIVLEDP